MKLVITGSLGHISKPLATILIQQGHTVTVISSKPEKQKEIEALGARAAIGRLEDTSFLTATFTGADAVYCMLPPPDLFNHTLDIMEYHRTISNSYAQAIKVSGVRRVIPLSSIGAHLDKGTGFILSVNYLENKLKEIPGISITYMRPTSFYYNLFNFLTVIRHAGNIISNYGGADMVSWVSPIDIAAAVAEELVTPATGIKVRYVVSDEVSCNEVARILGAAIGKPGLQWLTISNEELQSELEAAGIAPQAAAGLVELNASIHSGELLRDYFIEKPPVTGKIKMTDFARDFAAAYKQN
ncbi:NAD-dependent dehydratase [Niastella vici]|uniref:NAD-dependent dehydratase n=1 Tax=Niastella vici TaxID=1703345 RepID=A0A1V9G6U0_9BACT|nr:NmrA family NAD(P)-binding protein [Niastella vici]OQP66359.1 NAD-dependent dehydratase [Niastella vici]